MKLQILLQAALFAALGLALGAVHFGSLRANAHLYLAGVGRARPIALHAARVLGTAAVFVLVAQRGAAALLAALTGFEIARRIAITRARSAP